MKEGSYTGASKTQDVRRSAPIPVANTAYQLAEELFNEVLKDVRVSDEQRVVPEVTVLVSYRIEEK